MTNFTEEQLTQFARDFLRRKLAERVLRDKSQTPFYNKRLLAEFAAAVDPQAVLALLDEIDELQRDANRGAKALAVYAKKIHQARQALGEVSDETSKIRLF